MHMAIANIAALDQSLPVILTVNFLFLLTFMLIHQLSTTSQIKKRRILSMMNCAVNITNWMKHAGSLSITLKWLKKQPRQRKGDASPGLCMTGKA
ncbi:hypothetical protein [Paenibacillus larvae]|uniref:hypothetical protein n=1 Tax=Paenibacillus larvae TaxID=1464 RepID=UPI000CE94275|nr:hypothetical protein ERICII_02329 [Paenibacillus larvae subsp. larvae DSM 25430]